MILVSASFHWDDGSLKRASGVSMGNIHGRGRFVATSPANQHEDHRHRDNRQDDDAGSQRHVQGSMRRRGYRAEANRGRWKCSVSAEPKGEPVFVSPGCRIGLLPDGNVLRKSKAPVRLDVLDKVRDGMGAHRRPLDRYGFILKADVRNRDVARPIPLNPPSELVGAG